MPLHHLGREWHHFTSIWTTPPDQFCWLSGAVDLSPPGRLFFPRALEELLFPTHFVHAQPQNSANVYVLRIDGKRHYYCMKASVKILLFAALAGISLSSCIVPAGPPGAGVYASPVGIGIYPVLPFGYVGDAYFYGGRYYYGGRYEPGRFYYGGRYYDHRYYHGGRYYYGGRHEHHHH